MMKTRTLIVAGLGLAFVALLALNADRAVADEGMDIDQKIATAKTAADHEAIAKYFADEAEEAKKNAEIHRKMGETYKKMGGAAVAKWNLPAHCDSIAKRNESAAADYEKMAEAHRGMAKSAK